MESSEIVGLVVAVLGLGGAVGAALVSRQHDREQQTRAVQLPPAQEFIRAAYAGLAALRHITPPSDGAVPHRNEVLIEDRDARAEGFGAARRALDDVRSSRANVRLSFHPESFTADTSVLVIRHLRTALEVAETFYAECDVAVDHRDDGWRQHRGRSLRRDYLDSRGRTYDVLDDFATEVAARMVRPSWDPRRFRRRAGAHPY